MFGFGKKKKEQQKRELQRKEQQQKEIQQKEMSKKELLMGEQRMEEQQMEENDETGSFVGFVLLSTSEWDKLQLIKDLQEEWQIDATETDKDEKYDEIILVEVGDMRLAFSLMQAPVPDNEAEHYAAANYMWPDAEKIVGKHQAHILVAVLGDNTDILERGCLFTKAVSACLLQKNAIGIYTDGAVFEAEFYRGFAQMLKEDDIAIFNWIWYGIYRSENQEGFYTYGMKKFGKDEMEVYVDHGTADLNDIRDFLSDMVYYVLKEDVILHDGETIGFSEEQKLPIKRSNGIALDGMTLKIGYQQ